MIDRLDKTYCQTCRLSHRLHIWRKKIFWLVVVASATLIKRVFDIIVSSTCLLLLLPFMTIVAIVIKSYDGGPVFYISQRVGQWGKPFKFIKFRTMHIDADKIHVELAKDNVHGETGVTFKMKRDPRVTYIGRIFRKLSIDELPQLWSVIIGDMTLVGPRPPLLQEVAKYSLVERRRLDVVPGITCTWQVTGRADIPFKQQVKLDVDYIESQSFSTDLKILLATIPAILKGKGAY